jgi:hypothetical protein
MATPSHMPLGLTRPTCTPRPVQGWTAKRISLYYKLLNDYKFIFINPKVNKFRPTEQGRFHYGRMGRGGHGLPKVSLVPAMLYPSTSCGQPSLKWPHSHFKGSCPQGNLRPSSSLLDTPRRTPLDSTNNPNVRRDVFIIRQNLILRFSFNS